MHNYTKPIPVVYYHSVGRPNTAWARHYLTLELPFFENQLKYYKREFNVIKLKTFYNIRTGLQAPPLHPLVITFDDGYLDNWVWAFPLLRKYRLPATIFVCPETADPRNLARPNLDDYLAGEVSLEEISRPGHLSWEEMRLMEASGLIDIQSHTMTHTKYFVSGRLREFHHPGADALYPIGNLFVEEKPYNIANPAFEKLLPYGYPFFEEASSIIARKVEINPDFTEACVAALADYNFENYQFGEAFDKISPVYQKFLREGSLIASREPAAEYRKRMDHEIAGSKKAIEEKLGKKVEFLCWPHGDSSPEAHQAALEAGYLATTSGSRQQITNVPDRIPERIGAFQLYHNRLLSGLKLRYQIGRFLGRSPWKEAGRLYHLIR